MKYLLIFITLLNFSCSKQKSVLICGDHVCVNKSEAKQFFEDNLTIELQIISKTEKSSFNLVDLNINSDEPNIKIIKNKSNNVVKKLSKKEIKEKKTKVKNRMKKSEAKIKKVEDNDYKSQIKKQKFEKKREIKIRNHSKTIYSDSSNSIDICLKVKKCDIDSITNYLINASNDRDYPNISLRE